MTRKRKFFFLLFVSEESPLLYKITIDGMFLYYILKKWRKLTVLEFQLVWPAQKQKLYGPYTTLQFPRQSAKLSNAIGRKNVLVLGIFYYVAMVYLTI